MTREKHIENLKAIASYMPSDKCSDWIESLMAGVKALEQEPCTDAISRSKVLEGKVIHQFCDGVEIIDSYAVPVEYIEQLPPVTPTEKIGHWITTRTFMHDGEYYCDRCKYDAHNNEKWDYCPNCGKKMQEVEDDN